jgi:hypothetical protein
MKLTTMAFITLVAIVGAMVARHQLIEPSSMGIACALAKDGWLCHLREVLIWFLIDQRLGWLALMLGVMSVRIPWMAAPALLVAGVGSVLYNVELSGPAWLITGIAITNQHRARLTA